MRELENCTCFLSSVVSDGGEFVVMVREQQQVRSATSTSVWLHAQLSEQMCLRNTLDM